VFSPLAAVVPVIHGGFFFWPFFIIGPIFFILFVLFIIFVVVGVGGRRRRMARWGYGPWNGNGSPARGAESTLAERFAQGDIDEKEYRARLEVLRANDVSQQPSN
jgi:putative membrane protein